MRKSPVIRRSLHRPTWPTGDHHHGKHRGHQVRLLAVVSVYQELERAGISTGRHDGRGVQHLQHHIPNR